MTVAGVSAQGHLQPLTERIATLLAGAGTDPASNLPESFTYRELAQAAYATDALTSAQLSAVRRSVARLTAAGRAERAGRRYPREVKVRRALTPAERAAQDEAHKAAMRPLMERMEAKRRATPYPVDAGFDGVVLVEVEPVLRISEDGVELREGRELASMGGEG